MQLLALVWGILAIIGMVVAFFPCLGALNWLNIPFSAIGLVISVIAFATTPAGNKNPSIAGIICCSIAIILGFMRLVLGAGIV